MAFSLCVIAVVHFTIWAKRVYTKYVHHPWLVSGDPRLISREGEEEGEGEGGLPAYEDLWEDWSPGGEPNEWGDRSSRSCLNCPTDRLPGCLAGVRHMSHEDSDQQREWGRRKRRNLIMSIRFSRLQLLDREARAQPVSSAPPASPCLPRTGQDRTGSGSTHCETCGCHSSITKFSEPELVLEPEPKVQPSVSQEGNTG